MEEAPCHGPEARRDKAPEHEATVKAYYSSMEVQLGLCSQFQNKGLVRIVLGNQLCVLIFKTEFVERVLTSQKTTRKSFNYTLLHSWLGTGLLTSFGAKWKQRRRMLTPAFHFRILEDLVPTINEHARKMVKRLNQCSGNAATDIVSFSTECTMEILLETIMGVTTANHHEDIGSYVEAIKNLTLKFMLRFQNPWLYLDSIFYRTSLGRECAHNLSVVHSFSKKVIQKRREELVKERSTVTAVPTSDNELRGKKLPTFIDILLQHSLDFDALLTDDDIREEVDTFMFEGHDTTAVAIAWCIYLIGLHPEVQKGVHEELDAIVGDEPEKNITLEDLKKLTYLDRVIKECQRLYPSVPLIGRTASEDFEMGGHLIPAGANIGVFIYALHRDPDVFPKPEEFDPDRFLPENSEKRHPLSYLPFSAGPRNCIGQKFASMEVKIIVGHIMRSFIVQSMDPRDKLLVSLEIVLRVANGLRIKVVPRASSKGTSS
ncbi:cytochrome P450 4c3 [Ixodes scapularis]|uniref:cytochrome P450 4c3 n=1 Tax=Ixodes scapularis TaxID=6945 RepID=UPI001A9D565C|nr:cytochrome P450 4c3 [Ixodes scapularis]